MFRCRPSALLFATLFAALVLAPGAGFAESIESLQGSIQALLKAHERALPGRQGAAFRDGIQATLSQAQTQAAQGQDAAAQAQLEAAYRELTLAIRDAKQEPSAAVEANPSDADARADQRLQATYDRRRGEILILLQVLGRPAEQESAAETQDRQQLIAGIEQELRAADALRTQEPTAALARLDALYEREKQSIRGLKESAENRALGRQQPADKADPHKANQDFDRLNASIDELLRAQARILEEEHPDASPEVNVALTARHLQSEALKLRQAGQTQAARLTLNQSYDLIQHSVMRLREGRTLTRTLQFDTPEDEYAYEIQRHDMHLELADLLLGSKRHDPAVQRLAERVLKRSAELREQALSIAADGDYPAAIQSLEQASSEIYKLFRIAGIYVPD